MNQSAKHASLLTKLGAGFENYTYESAFHAYWDSIAIPTGTFNSRMSAWLTSVSATAATLDGQMHAYAISKSANDWDSLGDLGLP